MTALRGPLRKRESHLWVRDPDDWYVEPEWCSQRLFEVEKFDGWVWDPACGSGRILDAAEWAGHHDLLGTDIKPRGPRCDALFNFLTIQSGTVRPVNIVSNPPFGIAEKFVAHALQLAERKVAMLLPANWIQGAKRSRWLATTPLVRVWFLCPRPSMPPGAVIEAGVKPGNGTTDYAWFVWDRDDISTREFGWLYRDGDTTKFNEAAE